jgi:tRNA(Ile)-lysidine synthetase-like protein
MALLNLVLEQTDTDKVGVAHVNHNFREGSIKDLEFIKSYSSSLGLPFYSKTLSPPSGVNKEEYGRSERYKFLKEIRESEEYDWILTAHHRDDVIESFFMQIFFGRRVYGIAEKDEKRRLLRPILKLSRAEINEYIQKKNIPYVEDPTNADTSLLRNKIRLELMPILQSMFGEQVNRSVFESLREIHDLQLALEWSLKVPVEPFGSKEFLSSLRFRLNETPDFLKPYLIEKVCLPILGFRLGKTHRERTLSFFSSNAPEIQLPRGITLRRQNGEIIVILSDKKYPLTEDE